MSKSQAHNLLLLQANPAARKTAGLLKETVAGKEFNLTQAGSLPVGLGLLADLNPRLILLDFNLPQSGGLEGLEKLRATAPRTPVILLAAGCSSEITEKALGLGACDSLTLSGLDAPLLDRSIRYALRLGQVEEELSLSQGVFQASFETDISGMGLVSENGEIIRANTEFCRLLGYDRSALEGKQFDQIIHPLDLRFTDSMFKRSLAGEHSSFNFETRFQHREGKVVWAQISGGLVRPNSGKAGFFILHIRDITEPLYAATRLRQSEAKYHALFENIPDGVYRSTPEGIFLAANPALVRMLGYDSEDELKRVSVGELYADPADREEFLHLVETQDEVRNLEVQLRRRDGTLLTVLDNARAFRSQDGSLQYIEGSLTDISLRLQTQEALRESEARYRTVTEQIPGVVYRSPLAANFPDLYVSPQVEDLLGISPEEWLSNPTFRQEQVHPEDRQRVFDRANEARGKLADYDNEYRLISRDGRVVCVEDHARLVRDESGAPQYYQGLILDITSRKQIENTLRMLEEKFSKAFQSSPEAICTLRLGDGTLQDVNQGFTILFGHTREEVLGKSPAALGLWADLLERKNLLQAITDENEVNNFEISLRVKNGGLLNCRVSSRKIEINDEKCALLIIQDVTAIRRAAEALTESNRRLSDTLENINLAAVILDLDGNITFCNDYLLRLTGWQRGDVMDANWFELFATSPGAGDGYQESLRSGMIPSHAETTIRTREGGKLRFSWNNTALRDIDGQLTGMASIGEDITRRAWAEAALRESEERYRNIYENATIGMYRTTPSGDILMSNPALIRMLGFDSFEDLALRNLEQEPELVHNQRASFREQIEKDGVVKGLEAAWRRKDGSTIHVRESAKLVRGPDGSPLYYEGTIEDITERKQAEEALQRQLDRLNSLRTIDETIIGSPDLKFILNVLLEQVTAQLKADACLIMLFSEETRLLRFGASRGFRTDGLRQTTQRIDDTYSGRVARERTSLYVPDINKQISPFLRTALAGEDFVTYLGMPLIAKGQVKGVLEIYQRSAFKPNDEWIGLLEMMSGLAAISIENATLFEGLQRSNFDLETAYDSTLEGWARALDLRDHETEGHSRRVTGTTINMAQALGFNDHDIVQLRRGSLLHDIGKMGIPDSILLKKGTLTQAEWKIMRMHPVYAYELLSPIKYLQPALDIPYCHHERWDGSGYPRGLSGAQIPLPARIFAIVDVYDALISNRPYRPAWPKEKTYEYLHEQAGHLFDPQMVELFFKIKAEQG